MHKKNFYPLVIITTALALGYVLSNPLTFGLCKNQFEFNGSLGCLDRTIFSVGEPLYVYSLWGIMATLLIVFTSQIILKSWLKFSAWFLLLAFLYVALTPVSNTTIMDFFPYYRVDAARDAGIAFSVLTTIFVAWKLYAERKKSRA